MTTSFNDYRFARNILLFLGLLAIVLGLLFKKLLMAVKIFEILRNSHMVQKEL